MVFFLILKILIYFILSCGTEDGTCIFLKSIIKKLVVEMGLTK